jgi:hypothetical protein
MNLYSIVYNFIRISSILSILIILSIGIILPVSLIQGLLINPIIIVSLMVFFAVSHKKLQPVKPLANIIRLNNTLRLPDNSRLILSIERQVA